MVSTTESSMAWAEVVAHDAGFEFSDVIGFADGGPGGSCWRGGPWAATGRLHRTAVLRKPGGGARVLAVLDPAVHARYRAVVARVAPHVERSLGPEVAAGRCLPRRPGLAVEPWRPAWRRHRHHARRLGREAGPVLRMDVRDCFGSIQPEVVTEALARCGAGRTHTRELTTLLGRLRSEGNHGLPVGPEPSAVLANAVLGSADRVFRSLGLPFTRWCDDVAVGLRGTAPAVAMEAWADALRTIGLEPAAAKTRVDEGDGLPEASMRPAAGAPRGPRARGRRRAVPPSDAFEVAAAAGDEPDPFVARVMVAAAALTGGRGARTALRHVRRRAPYLCSTVEWGLRR